MSLNTEETRGGAPATAVAGAPSRAKRRRGPHRWTLWQRVSLGVAGVIVLGIVMELVSRFGFANPDYVPPLTSIIGRISEFLFDPDSVTGNFYAQVASTMVGFLTGLGIAVVLGIGLGVLFGLWEVSYRSSRTVIELLRPIPPVALIPVAILLLGSGFNMKTSIVVFACIWPIMFNALYGVRNVDPMLKDMARSFGRNRGDIVRSIVFPSALPLMWTGVRVASTIALIVIITTELIVGGSVGIGGIFATARAQGNDVLTFYAAIIVSGVLGLLVNLALAAVERRFFAWSKTIKEA